MNELQKEHLVPRWKSAQRQLLSWIAFMTVSNPLADAALAGRTRKVESAHPAGPAPLFASVYR